MFNFKQTVVILSSLLLLCLSPNIGAQQSDQQPQQQSGQWTFGIGMMAAKIAHYPGADQSRSVMLPFPYIHYRSKKFTIDRNGVRRKFLSGENWDINLSASGQIRVESKNNQARAGMPDLAWVAAVGPVFNYYFDEQKNQSLRLHIRKAFAFDDGIDSIGGMATLGFRQLIDLPDNNFGQTSFSASVEMVYGSSKYNDYFYGVAPQYANAERRQYHGNSGLMVNQLTLAYNIKNHPNERKFRAGMFLRATNLSGSEIENSPLVKQSTNINFGIMYAWLF